MNLNKVILIGRIGQDPEIKDLTDGVRVAILSLVTETRWKTKQGEKKSKSEWHKVVTFELNNINYCENFIKKGDLVMVEGNLTYRLIENGDKKLKLSEIQVGKYGGSISIFMSNKKNEENDSDDDFMDILKKDKKEDEILFDI